MENRTPEIEKNVPMPEKKYKYFWLKDMEVMDSVLLTSEEKRKVYSYVSKLSYKRASIHDPYFDDKEFTFRPEGDGFRMWRTK
tara:strand:- start:228 stop:476 length:249 start_codon:yes stop_codon:yes gene_type:complete